MPQTRNPPTRIRSCFSPSRSPAGTRPSRLPHPCNSACSPAVSTAPASTSAAPCPVFRSPSAATVKMPAIASSRAPSRTRRHSNHSCRCAWPSRQTPPPHAVSPPPHFATLLDPNTFFDTPNDTLEHLDFALPDAQEQSLLRFLLGSPSSAAGLVSDSQLYARARNPRAARL